MVNQVGAPGTQNIGKNGFPEIPQNYRTQEVTNNRTALYSLTLRNPQPPYAIKLRYIFPISPTEISQTSTEMSTIYDVAGDAKSGGVTRIADQYGISPITFTIEGTTGWKRHSTDGFVYTGLESAQLIRSLLLTAAEVNVQRTQSGLEPYILEFYDYFEGIFWEVVPIGQMILRQTSAKPLLFYYHLKLAGIRSLSRAPHKKAKNNVIDNMLSAASSNVANSVSNFSSQITGTYNEIVGAV